MAYGLTFGANTTDNVDCGSAAALDDKTSGTWLIWCRPTTLTTGKALCGKDDNASPFGSNVIRLSGASGDLQTFITRATTSTNYITNTTPLSATGTSACIAAQWDTGAAAGELVNIHKGLVGATMAEATYGTATDGSGAQTGDAAATFVIGNRRNGGTAAFQGDIYLLAWYNGVLSAADIEKWRLRPVNIVLGSSCLGAWILGNNGSTGSQADLTGNGNNGTVTGATAASTALALALHGHLCNPIAPGRSLVGGGMVR